MSPDASETDHHPSGVRVGEAWKTRALVAEARLLMFERAPSLMTEPEATFAIRHLLCRRHLEAADAVKRAARREESFLDPGRWEPQERDESSGELTAPRVYRGDPAHVEKVRRTLAEVEAEHPGTVAEMLALPDRLVAEAKDRLGIGPLDPGRWVEQEDGSFRLPAAPDPERYYVPLEDRGDAWTIDGVPWSPENLEAAARIIRARRSG